MSMNESLRARREAAIPRGVGTAHAGIFAARARNAEIWDADGRRLIDFASGIAVTNVGHVRPEVVEAAKAQIDLFTHVCFQVTGYESYIALAERLNALAPGPSAKKTIFLSTGAEAVENAIKIARSATGRPGVIAFSGGFHGRTMLGMALTGKVTPYKTGFGPFLSDIYHLPFPAPYLGVSEEDSIAAMEVLFRSDIDPGRIAAIIVEPVQGEGGFYPVSPGFMRHLRSLCDAHGILLIADEIQTGFGRTGRLFACEHLGVEPDLMTVAKSIAGGFPLSAVIGRAEIMDAPQPGGLGGTYGGSPVACAAGLAVLDVIEADGLCARADWIGERIAARLRQLSQRDAGIGDIRALGAMAALELVQGGDAASPDPARTGAAVAEARERGLILLACGVRGNVIRFLPPLTIEEDVLDEGLDILADALERTGALEVAA